MQSLTIGCDDCAVPAAGVGDSVMFAAEDDVDGDADMIELIV